MQYGGVEKKCEPYRWRRGFITWVVFTQLGLLSVLTAQGDEYDKPLLCRIACVVYDGVEGVLQAD